MLSQPKLNEIKGIKNRLYNNLLLKQLVGIFKFLFQKKKKKKLSINPNQNFNYSYKKLKKKSPQREISQFSVGKIWIELGK